MAEHESDWKPIETVPQTLKKFQVARRYTEQVDFVQGLHAFHEQASNGKQFYAYWLDAPDRPPVESV
jgi:hypothetical protein